MSLLEAFSVIGEFVVSKILDSALEKVISVCSEFLNFPSDDQILDGLRRLKEELQRICALLDVAEERQLEDRHVKILLSKIQNGAYDLDDIVDELEIDASRRKLMERRPGSSSERRRLNFSDLLNDAGFKKDMMSKIAAATAILKDLEPWINQLQQRVSGSQNSNKRKERQPSTSILVETHVYGRDEDKQTILEMVLKGNDEGNFVIPIVGMGGIGKTTLAQFVYNDASVQKHFHLRAWICVSDDFDVTRITKDIYQSVFSNPCDGKNLSSLQEKLKEEFSKKRFLIVLDDIWNDNYHNWTILRAPFLARTPGSKIIVTTRSSGVSSIMGASYTHSLEVLSEDDCLSVLAQHALGARDFEGHPDLNEVAEKIARKCNGLPLAAKTLGGLLGTDVDHDAWKKISESDIWKQSYPQLPRHLKQFEIIPTLHLSYHHLPPHLKRCFAYCSILPKDYEFEEKEMILLWRAEGFLQEVEDKHSIEDLGHEYFRDLLSRSLLQRSNKNRSRFVMHDLINDLAQSVAGEICFRIEGDQKISKHARHLSYITSRYDGIKKFKGVSEVQHLRTFLPFSSSHLNENRLGDKALTNDFLRHLLPSLRCLRVLSLERYQIFKLPNSLGDLKHLRYLNFSRTCIIRLPESISTLYNLETLLLSGCCLLEKLPSEMEKLVNLCYLDISDTRRLKSMPSNFCTLSDLQTLSTFILQKGKGCQIRELENLSHLKGQLCISGLENVVETQDVCKAKLHDKSRLDKLELKWSQNVDNRSREIEEKVLDLLQPSKMLSELALDYYYGVRLAKWLGDPSFNNLESLCLEDCRNCTSLPSIGQLPSLKNVRIKGLHRVTIVGVEFFGMNALNAFPLLESLKFEDMPKWEKWNFIESDEEVIKFPKLGELSTKCCPQLLGSLPENLPSLKKLEIDRCEKLMISIQNLPKLSELKIVQCHKVVYKGFVDGSSLKRVSFSKIPKFICAAKWLMPGSIKVDSLEISFCEELCSLGENNWRLLTQPMSLGELSIAGFPQIVSIGVEEGIEELMQLKIPSTIQRLNIRDCGRLDKLSTTLHYVTSLSLLELYSCAGLISISMNNLPFNLKSLVIKSCNNLRCLFEEGENGNISNACLLEELEIRDCPKLISLSNNNLPLNLKMLSIWKCADLRCLLGEGENVDISNACLLEQLKIWYCGSLVSLSSRGELPASLKQLDIGICEKLEPIAQEIQANSSLESIRISRCSNINYLPQGLSRLNHLRRIFISNCSSLVSFPEGGLPTSCLKVLVLLSCESLQALPDGIHNLNSLEELRIECCSSVRSFPEEGIPTNIKKLKIKGPNICKSLIEWGLRRLTSLQYLSISNGYFDAVSFPQHEVGLTLPSSLTRLEILDFPKLEILSSEGFQDLTSLKFLTIKNCPSLKSFPEKDKLSSLLWLCICSCPLMRERCVKDKGPEWSKIAHIPSVKIYHNGAKVIKNECLVQEEAD